MAELDLSNIAAASIATPVAGVTAVYVETATKLLSTKDDAGLVRAIVDVASAQAVTGVKTLTNPTSLLNTATVPAQTIPAGGALLTVAAAGAIESDAATFYQTHNTTDGRAVQDASRWFRLTSPGGNITAIADAFGANSAIGMAASGVYEIEWHVWTVQNVGAATNWTWTITLSGAVTRASAAYDQCAIAGIAAAAAVLRAGTAGFTTTQALPVTGSCAAATHYTIVRCLVDVGASPRDVRLRLTVAANSAAVQAGSYYRARRVSAGNTGAFTA